jgi:ATP-binding cassette subfamily C protein
MTRILRQLALLLTPAQRRRWLSLVPLLFVAGAIETASTGLVFGLIKIAGDPGYVFQHEPLATLFRALPGHGPGAVVLGYGVFLATFFVARSVILLGITFLEQRAGAETAAQLSTRLFDAYLTAPYAVHLRHSPTELAHDATQSIDWVVAGGMISVVQAVAEILVSVGLATFLIVASPIVTLVTAGALGTLVGLAVRLTKRSSLRMGKVRQQISRRAVKEMQQSLGGLREIHILGRERAFHDAFVADQQTYARTRRLHGTLVAAPRLAIETIFVCCIVLIVGLVMLGEGRAEIMPLLGVYAYAGFRFIPAANRILMFHDAIRGAAPTVDRIHTLLEQFEGARPAPAGPEPELGFERAIELEHVSYRYETSAAPVLSDVNLTIRRGESVGIVGATGAGKSTLIDLILGLLEPTAGRIAIDGVDVARARRSWQRRIGYVPQAAFLFDDTIARNVALGVPRAEIDAARLDECLRMAQLADFVAALPDGAETQIGERGIRLSGGQRQRIAIARALYRQPEVLVFDEATAALDNATEREVSRAIEGLRGQKTLIIIAHRLSTVQRCDALVFLRAGRVGAVGPFDRLLEESEEFRAMAALPVGQAADA